MRCPVSLNVVILNILPDMGVIDENRMIFVSRVIETGFDNDDTLLYYEMCKKNDYVIQQICPVILNNSLQSSKDVKHDYLDMIVLLSFELFSTFVYNKISIIF